MHSVFGIGSKRNRTRLYLFISVLSLIIEPVHEISNNVVMCDQQSLRSACANAQSDQSLCYLLEYSMIVKLLTEHHLEFQKEAAEARPSLHWSKCQIVGLNYLIHFQADQLIRIVQEKKF